MEPLEIDGSHGEGGGQMVRSAVLLSCVTGRPIRMRNIRQNRRVAGLRPQHLAAVRILQKVSNAEVTGAGVGSTEMEFVPRAVRGGRLAVDVGTAGSIPLILQSVMPLAGVIERELIVVVRGGTDVSWSPSMDYTRMVLCRALEMMGVRLSLNVKRRGYYPSGGGVVEMRVHPSSMRSISLGERVAKSLEIHCTVSRVPVRRIMKDVGRIRDALGRGGLPVRVHVVEEEASDAGASLLASVVGHDISYGKIALYDMGMDRFDVDTDGMISDRFATDPNLSDMLVVPACLAGGTTRFQVREVTEHLKTNLFVASEITGCRYGVGRIGGGYEVIIEGTSHPGVHEGRKE